MIEPIDGGPTTAAVERRAPARLGPVGTNGHFEALLRTALVERPRPALGDQPQSARPAVSFSPDRATTLGRMLGLAQSGPLSLGSASSIVGGADGRAVVERASRYLGVPYRWGGTDPASGLDCSGLIQRTFADLGVRVPRTSAEQAQAGSRVSSLAEARPGDLLFWESPGGGSPNHIGIYVGGDQMLHAPRTGDVVKVGPIRSAPPTTIRRIAASPHP